MSRIGKVPINIPKEVSITLEKSEITVKGPKGELKLSFPKEIKISHQENFLILNRKDDSKKSKSLHGTFRTIINNMINGVHKGFEKKLEIIGVGFRAQTQGSKLNLNLGFSHPIEIQAPHGIQFTIDQEKKNLLTISGYDKQLVGEIAAKIRSLKKPEPYKGKGIRYLGEQIIRKAGKAGGKDK